MPICNHRRPEPNVSGTKNNVIKEGKCCSDIILQEFISTVGLRDKARNEKFDIFLDHLITDTYIDMDSNETYSQTGFNLILDRSTTKFFVNIYIPTSLLTIASFIGFLIPVEMVPGRMALLVTIFLMLVNISSTEQNRGPIVRQT